MSRVIVVGAGAAGMMAAIKASENGHQVTVLEKNEKAGKKLFITGKGRCNITNACDVETLLNQTVTNSKFLYSAFYGFDSFQMIDFIEGLGVKTKTERGSRVFPQSDKSSDVISALQKEMRRLGVSIRFQARVKELWVQNGSLKGVITESKEKIEGDAVIIAAGGFSYQTTGSTGDGYELAKKIGHTVTPLSPALVPLTAKEDYVKELQGLSLRNIEVTIQAGKKILYQEFGEMLFTHYGVSGPVLLSASSFIAKKLQKQHLDMTIDLKPALSAEQLDLRILRDFEQVKNKQFRNSLSHLFPSKLIPVMIERTGIDPDKKVNEITKEERQRLILLTKKFPVTLTGLRGFHEAIITQGGVSVKEVNPTTMESKRMPGVYLVGEVLDLDAVTGGFNLQIAWSTGYAAGISIN